MIFHYSPKPVLSIGNLCYFVQVKNTAMEILRVSFVAVTSASANMGMVSRGMENVFINFSILLEPYPCGAATYPTYLGLT